MDSGEDHGDAYRQRKNAGSIAPPLFPAAELAPLRGQGGEGRS